MYFFPIKTFEPIDFGRMGILFFNNNEVNLQQQIIT